MKLTAIRFIILLGLLSTINFPALAAENRGERISLAERVRGLDINNLFKEHQLPQTMAELGAAEAAYSKGERMLRGKEGVKALPYLIYAEHYMVPESLTTLERVGAGFYEKVPEKIQNQVKQALSNYNSEFSKYNNQGSIFKMYVQYWKENEKRLGNSQKTSFFGSLNKLIFGESPSFPNSKPMQSISSEALFGKQLQTSPYSSNREGTAEDMIPLLPGELERKTKKE
jgi:hypothetical protein